MPSFREQLIDFIQQGVIPAQQAETALDVSGVRPDGRGWYRFMDHLFVWLGGLSLAFAMMFFIAYNWDALGRYARFALVEVFLVLAIVAYWRFGAQSMAGKTALLVATILLGVLLALFGQTYQTGADPWQLFFTWAMLMLPWAFIGRFAAIWMLWLLLINLSIVLYHQAFVNAFWVLFARQNNLFWVLLAVNAFALVLWESAALRWRWLNARWAVRFIAVIIGAILTWLVMFAILDDRRAHGYWEVGIWLTWVAAFLVVYQKFIRDLFMLAGVSLSGIIVIVTTLIRHIFKDENAGAFLLIAFLIVAMAAGAAVWLRYVQKRWQRHE